MTLDEIKDFLGQDWKDTDALIRSSLESDISLLNATNKAILDHSGKQLRPIVSLLVARACGGGRVNADSVRYAAAAELLHNATLLHDDVADSSCERRGAPTVMAILGGPASVLLGDFWLVKALENILASSANCNEVIRIFAGTLSSLAEGEMLQLQKASSGDTVEEDYYRIIYSKTASLFEAAFVSAAISVNAPADWIEAVRDYAVSLGSPSRSRTTYSTTPTGRRSASLSASIWRSRRSRFRFLGHWRRRRRSARSRSGAWCWTSWNILSTRRR